MSKTLFRFALVFALLSTGAPLTAQYADHRNRGIDSLEQALATNQMTEGELAAAYLNLAWGYKPTDIEKSMDYARKTIDIAISLDGWRAVADAYGIIGICYYGRSEYDSAMLHYNKALEAAERMRDFPEKYTEERIDDELAYIHGNIGNAYNAQGMLHEAVEEYIKALRIFEKYDFKESQIIAHNNIGKMYMLMDNWEQAEDNYRKSDSLALITGDELMIAYVKQNLADLYLSTKEYDRALQSAEAARSYFFAHPEEGEYQVSILNTLAQIYLDGYDDVAQAEVYVRQGLLLTQTNEVVLVTQASTLGLLAEIHFRRGEWRTAAQAALEALALDDSEPANTLSLYEVLAKAYSHLGDAAKSDDYFDRHNELQSSWSTKHYQSAIRDMEVKYETEKKETQISALESEKRQMIWLSIAGGAILLLALAALFFLWRWTAQRKRLAEQQVKQLEQEKKLVATQAVLDGEIQERTRLARDLHDGLGSILTGTKINMQEMKNGATMNYASQERYDTAMNLIDQSMSEMRRVAHHLMPEALTAAGLKQSIADFCHTIPCATFNWYGEETPLDSRLEVIVYRIMHELVNNALKHSGAEHILVELVRYEDTITLTVQDNGCGFDPLAESKGMGLANIRARVAAYNGNLMIDSIPGTGTEINIELRMEKQRSLSGA